jgi:hypothetical protein
VAKAAAAWIGLAGTMGGNTGWQRRDARR